MSQEDKNLNDFISRADDLFKLVVGGRPTENGFDRDFQELKKLSSELKQSEEHRGLTGQKPENKKKNRYKDITPFDSTRVKLTVTNNDPFSDYINASFIKGAEGHRNYIASQGPLPHTVLDFWQMLWQYNIGVIVMVCREIELGKRKCERYWAEQDSPKNFGGITVSLSEKQDLRDGYCLRTIKAQKGSETRYIQQFHYTSWPDHGVPKACFEIISLINHIRAVQSYSKDLSSPLCVHCSAGCGRTGAVLAVDFVRNLLDKKAVPSGLKMFDVISDMRRQRPAIVQTKDQYEFVNSAVAEMFRIYMQTRTVAYKGFSVGYEGDQYVNVNVTAEEKSKDKRNGVGPPKPTAIPEYENVDLRNRSRPDSNSLGKGGGRQASLDDYPENAPPAKPPLRPVSVILPQNTPHSDGAENFRKFSVPVISTLKADLKQSALPQTAQKPGQLTPTAKSRVQNLNNLSSLSPVARARSPSGSPMTAVKESPKPPPAAGRPKPKPEPAPKNITTALALKSPGNTRPVSPMHGDSAPILSSNKPKLSSYLPLTPVYGDGVSPTVKSPLSPPIKPPLTPLQEKLQKFDKTDTPAPIALSPKKTKPKNIALKIREDNDAPTDSESDSPALKGNFVLPNSEKQKSPPPAISPKPKVSLKPPAKGFNTGLKSSVQSVTGDSNSRGDKKLPSELLRPGKPKQQPIRPLSQTFSSTGLPGTKKNGISSSVFDLTEVNKKTPPPVQQKTMIVRSSSVSGIASDGGNEKTSFVAVRAKFQAGKAECKKEESDSKGIQVKVVGFTQTDGSYGPVFAATSKPLQSEKLSPASSQRRASTIQIQTPQPYKPQSRHSISKLNTSSFQEASESQIFHSNLKKTTPPPYENTDINPSKRGTSKSGLTLVNSSYELSNVKNPEADPLYVNTDVSTSDSSSRKRSNLPQYENQPIRFGNKVVPYEITVPQDSVSRSVVSKSGPKEDQSDVPDMHGFVSSTPSEGAKPKGVEDMKKKAPIKPKRSIRIKNTEGPAASASSSTTASKASTISQFQKYNKRNLYSDIDPPEDGDKSNAIVKSAYETLSDSNAIVRSNSTASADRSSTGTDGPPRLPARTAMSQMLLDDAPPELPTRTAESYMTIEDSNDEQQYEAVDTSTSALSVTVSRSSPVEGARRQSNTSNTAISSGTNFLTAKAKKYVGKEDLSGNPSTTVETRTPTYVPAPVVYNGQDMSFGKRLMKKVRGGRKLK